MAFILELHEKLCDYLLMHYPAYDAHALLEPMAHQSETCPLSE